VINRLSTCLNSLKTHIVKVYFLAIVLNVEFFNSEDESLVSVNKNIHNQVKSCDSAVDSKGNAIYVATITPGIRHSKVLLKKEEILWCYSKK
jgi:hypothetical protein